MDFIKKHKKVILLIGGLFVLGLLLHFGVDTMSGFNQ